MSGSTRGSVRRVEERTVVEAERTDGVAFVEGSDCDGMASGLLVECRNLALVSERLI